MSTDRVATKQGKEIAPGTIGEDSIEPLGLLDYLYYLYYLILESNMVSLVNNEPSR